MRYLSYLIQHYILYMFIKNLITLFPEGIGRTKRKFIMMFKNYEQNCHLIQMHDFYKAMDNFINLHDIDFLITVPKHRSILTSIFKTTHTGK